MVKKQKRVISIILMISIIITGSSTFQPGEAYAITQQQCENLDANIKLNPPPTFPKCSANGMPFNTTYWNDLGIVVYGDATKVPNNQYKPKWQNLSGIVQNGSEGMHPYFNGGEYRYYGWDKLGNLYTNPYFINDKNGSDPSERKWIYRPWSNSLLNGHPNKPTEFSPLLDGQFEDPDFINDPDEIDRVNQIIQTQAVTIKNSTINDPDKHLFNYMYVQQNPSVWAPGSGRMFSLGYNNKIWYQTFMLDEITAKNLTPVMAKIDSFPIDNPTTNDQYPNGSSVELNSFTTNTFHLKFRMSGTIQDRDFMSGPNKEYLKAANYTRDDLDAWDLKIEVQHEGQPLTTLRTFTTPEVILNGNMGYNDLDIPVNKMDYENGGTLRIILTATATYHSKNSPKPRPSHSTAYTISFDEPPPPPEPLEEVSPLICTPNIPEDAFDIVPFAASDDTDMSLVQSRTVTIDGALVDANLFFGGGYIFGDGQDGLRMVTVRWTPKTPAFEGDEGCQETRHVRVHDTKPRAQYKLNGGTWKENRTITIDNTSLDPNANDPYVTAAYPITNWSWSYEGTNGSTDSDRRMGASTDMAKELLYKKKGTYRITLTATNSLGRTSEPYFLDFSVVEDYAPAVILHPYNSQIGRGEDVSLTYNTVSTDGDVIDTHTIKIYYDADNNHTYSQFIETILMPLDTNYTPPANQLGRYKIVAAVAENFGENTLSQHITAADRRVTTVETVFEVDNYIPYSDIFTSIPYERAEVDLYMMLDRNLAQSKINYVNANGVTINNQLRYEGMDPQVNIWDMHTYTYSQSASTSQFTGTSYPPSSTYYSSNGYAGTLYLTSVSNNGYYYDYGYYTTVTESKSATGSRSQSNTLKCGQTEASNIPSSISYSDGDGYSGTLAQSSYTYSSTACSKGKYSYSRYATYSGTVYRTRTVWVSNVQYVNQYTGYYSGTIYKDVRQPYTNPFTRTTSNKYVVYISDDIINDLVDFNTAKAQSDAEIILVGNTSILSQTTYDHFIPHTGQSIENIVESVVDYIASYNPPIATETVELNEAFSLYTLEIDAENDPLIQQQTMYVHRENFYDNSRGRAAYAVGAYDENAWTAEMLRSSFDLPGQYTIFRRVEDQPSNQAAFADYGYYSNEAQIRIHAHRKPIARATLDWTYTTGCSCYRTEWVDESYDLDHEFSDPDRGIIDRKVRYQLNGGSWVYAVPDYLDPGTYNLEYQVQDMELAWSDVFPMNFTLTAAPPIQMTAKARTELAAFNMGNIPASEQLRIYDIWTRYPYSHSLSAALYQGNTQRTTAQTVAYYSGTKSGDDIDWNDIVYTIPNTTADGSYMLRLTAIGQAGQTNYMEFPVTVNTPIDLAATAPNPLVVGQVQDLGAVTTKYPNTVSVQMFRGTSYQSTTTLVGTQSAALKNWLRAYTVPDIPDGSYTLRFTAVNPSGKSEFKDVIVQLTHNRPPVASFDWAPKPVWEGDTVSMTNQSSDPDGDVLAYSWQITGPGNYLYSSTSTHVIRKFPQPGNYTVTLTVSDGTNQIVVTRIIEARPLELEPNVSHTAQWLTHHEQQGHETEQHPKSFYTGEIFVVSAVSSPAAVRRVTADLNATGRDGRPIAISVNLVLTGTTDYYRANLYDPILSSLTGGLPEGLHQIRFRIEYTNGVVKESWIPINIIGHVHGVVNVHRRQ
jgi:hypothetical protein